MVGERAVLVAAGLPAAYAVQLGVDQPELVRALALVVPLGMELHGDEPDLKDAVVHRLLRLPVLGTSALNLFTSRSGITSYLRREVYASPALVDDALVEEHYRNSHLPGAHAALAAYLAGYLNHGVRDALGRSTCRCGSPGAGGRRARRWNRPICGCATCRRPSSRCSSNAASCPTPSRPRSSAASWNLGFSNCS